MLSEENIFDALRACFDTSNPWKRPLNMVDLGLVEAISLALDPDAPGAGIPGLSPRQRLTLTLIPASSDTDANSILLAQVRNRLAGLRELSHATVTLLEAPLWTSTRISPELRRTLQLDPPTFPILNNR